MACLPHSACYDSPMIRLTIASLVAAAVMISVDAFAQQPASMSFGDVYLFDEEPTTSANASIGDLNGDGNLDVILIRGRHWPVQNRYYIGNGDRSFGEALSLGKIQDRSYTGALTDLDSDGDLDVVVSNDSPDQKLTYLNDGEGRFTAGSTFGRPGWNTRNISVADMNDDGLPDIIVANRGPLDGPSPNYICLNRGDGLFDDDCHAFSQESATTITPAYFNDDDLIDLVVPHRDGGQSHIYIARGGLHFDAIPFGPPDASIRAAISADFDNDGYVDIVAIHTGNSEGGDGLVERGRDLRGAFIYYGTSSSTFADARPLSNDSRFPYALFVSDLDLDGDMDIQD